MSPKIKLEALVRQLEIQLGRSLTAEERHLLALAEAIGEADEEPNGEEQKSA